MHITQCFTRLFGAIKNKTTFLFPPTKKKCLEQYLEWSFMWGTQHHRVIFVEEILEIFNL